MEIIVSKSFKKQAKRIVKNKPKLKEKINDCIIDFAKNLKSSKYYRKKLKGNYYGYEELQIGGDISVIARVSNERNLIVFEKIGTHSFFGW